jgi:predicted DNA-binding protein with PD1-like motif/glutaredoxin
MRAKPFHLEAGADLRGSLEAIAQRENAVGFVLSVVGNMSQATFACPGADGPTVLQGELEIITIQGTVSPQGVHLHLSFSDGACQVWGGHLEHGSHVLKGADLLVGFLEPEPTAQQPQQQALTATSLSDNTPVRVQLAVAEGCPWSRRAERLLRGLGIPFEVIEPAPGPVPQIHIDGRLIGGYRELADLHGRGALRALRGG